RPDNGDMILCRLRCTEFNYREFRFPKLCSGIALCRRLTLTIGHPDRNAILVICTFLSFVIKECRARKEVGHGYILAVKTVNRLVCTEILPQTAGLISTKRFQLRKMNLIL